MSNVAIERALHAHLIALTPTWLTKRPGVEITASEVSQKSWQRGTTLWSRPQTVAFGDGAYSRGLHIFQIDLMSPKGRVKELLERAELVRDWFFPATRKGVHDDLADLIWGTRIPAISAIDESGSTHNRVSVDFWFYADDAPTA